MKNKREQEAIRAYFAQEPVPVEIHNALRQACQQLPPREESPAPAAGKAWRRLGGALSTAAAAYHSGWGTVDGLLESSDYSADGEVLHTFPYQQMGLYVTKINRAYERYQALYGA